MATNDFQLENFFQVVKQIKGVAINTDELDINRANKNIGEFKRTILGIIEVKNKESLTEIVGAANEFKVSLHPYSQGCNWGYGSKLPSSNNCVLLDLSFLKKIIDIDEEHGIATIEPGVTQIELADQLTKLKSSYFFDVTGSGMNTSIIGNALERGIAYGSQRVSQVLGMRIILGSGLEFSTGFGDYDKKVLDGCYSYGLGPSLDGLFFQSNFGIVTEMKIRLNRRPEGMKVFSITVNDAQMPLFILTLSNLLKDGYLSGIPHIANFKRLKDTVVPLVCDQSGLSYTEAESVVRTTIKNDWILSAAVHGPPKILEIKVKRIRLELSKFGAVYAQSFSSDSYFEKFKEHIKKHLMTSKQKMVYEATRSLRDFHLGIPSNSGVRFLGSKEMPGTLDDGIRGFLLCTPLMPLTRKDAEKALTLIKKCEEIFETKLATTLNLISTSVLEAVISIEFERSSSVEVKKAHDLVNMLNKEFCSVGYYPYRLNIDQQNLFSDVPDSINRIFQSLKKVFDPNNIISNGRYVPDKK